MFEQGLSIEDVALQLDRAVDTVGKYLAEYLKVHRISDIDAWIPGDVQQQVQQAIGQVGCERLKPVFEHLGGQIDYARIRIVATAWELQQASEDEND